jgi:ribokinase
MNNYDFLAVGDIVVDAFIHISDAEASCDLDQEHCKLTLRFGDKVPYDFMEDIYAVGNSPNAAVSASRLGLKSTLHAIIGDDINGKECLRALTKDRVLTENIDTDEKLPTNYHFVLWYEPERTILVKHYPYERKFPKNIGSVKWLYLSSLGEYKAMEYHAEVLEYLKQHPETKLAFQPGTFQMKSGIAAMKGVYERTELFFCNFEESQRILNTTEKDIKKLLQGIADLGPKIVVITDGMKGAYCRDTNGDCYFIPVYPNKPYERTGAGDAFASTFTSCLGLGMPLTEAMLWAPINSMSVTESVGAQKGLLTPDKIREYLAKAPAEYKVSKI